MKKFSAALVLLWACTLSLSLYAQVNEPTKDISIWFLEERFLIADQNDDALLERSELDRFPKEFAYYLEDRHYQLADLNQDGYLSFNEINVRRRTENIYLYSQQRKELREVSREYLLLPQADLKYLKDNPALVAVLFSNLIWMYEHPELAESLYQDKRWMVNHPEVSLALHTNLRWLAAHPSAANQLYRDRETTQRLPELLGWRASHKELIRSMPEIEQLMSLDFIPQEIQMNQ